MTDEKIFTTNSLEEERFDALFSHARIAWGELLRREYPSEKNLEKVAQNAAIFSGYFRIPAQIPSEEKGKILAIARTRSALSRKAMWDFLQREKLPPERFSPARAEQLVFEQQHQHHPLSLPPDTDNFEGSGEPLSRRSGIQQVLLQRLQSKAPETPQDHTPNTESPQEQETEAPSFEDALRKSGVTREIEAYLKRGGGRYAKQQAREQEKQRTGISVTRIVREKAKKSALKWTLAAILGGTALGVSLSDSSAAAAGLDFFSNL